MFSSIFSGKNTPIDSVVAITYKCNSRCTMCDIWKIKDHHDVDNSFYKKLPKSLEYINISGGEPFLRPDIVEIIDIILQTCPKAQLVISSNGFATQLVVDRMKKILELHGSGRVGIALSIDGMREMHDKIRRIPNGFDKIIETIKKLKELNIKGGIRIAFTVVGENINDLESLYNLSRELGVEFTMSYAQSSDFYFGGKQNDVHVDPKEFTYQMNTLIKNELKGFDIKRWLRAFFFQGIVDFAQKKKQPLPIVSGSKHFFVDPKGDIYPSVVHNMIMGNIKDVNTFDELWYGEKATDIRESIRKQNKPVWMVCTARTAIIQYPIRVLSWIIKHKFQKS